MSTQAGNSGITPLILKAQVSEGEPEHILVEESPYRVGRRPDNHKQIVQPDVSGAHAEFLFVEGYWWLCDKNSTNGTFINGKRLTGRSKLTMHDVVHFATKAYQVVPKIDRPSDSPFQTRLIGDSTEIKGMLQLVHIVNEQRTYPYFQPLISLKDNQTTGWEALGRACGTDGFLNPGFLFSLAAQNKVEGKLSLRFRESARVCAECRHCWPESRESDFLFFNLHPAEIEQPTFIESLRELGQSDLRQWYQIVIEMPESWVANASQMQRLVKEIRSAGMLVAYDDFGAGQSRIPDLINVPPDFLKLDRQLIASLGSNKVKTSLVKAIVDASRELQVRTIGEGIETQDEMDACIEMGVDWGQGFLICPPKPAYNLFKADQASLPEICPFVKLQMLPDRTA